MRSVIGRLPVEGRVRRGRRVYSPEPNAGVVPVRGSARDGKSSYIIARVRENVGEEKSAMRMIGCGLGAHAESELGDSHTRVEPRWRTVASRSSLLESRVV